ncbi:MULTISPECIES: DMT family transporter [Leptolyngbya]|uniref:EamA family transporter n=1 Tax=Leptolyngbya boryana CZ1 TaxID=3060204 RepID=A0AA96WUD8_LEPBY|nr:MULTISPECIES: DMT family transporter [Leptolyngbya]MCY6492383.1 EamA family transporter [Leptolyngbya sp. GGD]WNZ45737.1 EamA family transporter [Leptolyngbya boryana CZ1]
MIWLAFAILTAFFESLKDVSSKYSLRNLDVYIVAWTANIFAVLFLIPLLFAAGIPKVEPGFWVALLIGGTLNVISFTLYIRAIQIADLSLTVPLVTLTPLFLLVTSPLIVQENPTFADAIGIALIVIGSYVLNLRERKKGYFAPLKALLKNKGSRFMLMVAFIWSITSNFDKVGVVNSSPLFWSTALYAYLAVGMFPIALFNSRHKFKQILPNLQPLMLIGFFHAIAITFQMIAVTYTLVTQVIAIKRMSALISVLFGHFLFRETGLEERLGGAAIMVFGVIVLTLF